MKTLVFFLFLSFLLGNGSLRAQQTRLSAGKFLAKHKQYLLYRQLRFLKEKSTQAPRNYNVRYYRLKLRIDEANRQIYGSVHIKLTSLKDRLNNIMLDMSDSLKVDSIGGAAVLFKRQNLMIRLDLMQNYNQGDTLTVAIFYHGDPEISGFNWFRFDKLSDGSPHIWTLSEPYGARYWWPCDDRPADKADSADIFVTVPAGLLVGSNGTLRSVSSADNGWKTFHWREQYPIATYLVSLAIAPYSHFQNYYHYGVSDSMLLDYYVYPNYAQSAPRIFSAMKDYINALSFYFGPYPFLKEKYGMAQFGWGGAMEHQTLTSIGRVADRWKFVYVHELAHQWFGDAVTPETWRDIWLNEGFATYAEALYAEWAGYENFPPGLPSLKAYMDSKFYDKDGTIIVTDTTRFSSIFNRIVYYKGAWVLHMLRHVMGDNTFFTALKNYVQQFPRKYGTVRTADFREVCEQTSGLNLNAFFDQWLHYPFFPHYAYSWQIVHSNDHTYRVKVRITQTQSTPVYRMPIDLTFTFKNGTDTSFVLQDLQRQAAFLIELKRLPVKINLDKDGWILKQVQEKDLHSFSTRVSFEQVSPNPFAKNLFIHIINWQAKQTRLIIYNSLGQKIRQLEPFEHSHYNYYYKWNGCNTKGQKATNGIYFLVSPNSGSACKVVLLH